MTQESVVSSIERRFQVVLTLCILFPVLFSTHFAARGAPESEVASEALPLFGFIAINLLSYCLFEACKRTLHTRVLVILNYGLLLIAFLFISPITMTAISLSSIGSSPVWIVWTNVATYMMSMFGLVPISVILLFLIAGSAAWRVATSKKG